MQHRSLFSPADIDKALQKTPLTIDGQDTKLKILNNWRSGLTSGKTLTFNEKKLQSEFLNKIFGDVLGYAYDTHLSAWQLEPEYKVDFDGKTPDGVLGYFQFDVATKTATGDVRAIIELKGPLVNLDKKQNRKDFPGTPVEQAFSYVPKLNKPCEWVIVSNCQEIRLYRYSLGMLQYESFDLLTVPEPLQFVRFCWLLQKDHLFLQTTDSPVETILQKREQELKSITNRFYADYKRHRESLFGQLRADNTHIPANELFRATQKLIDRLIFICFARDLNLVDNVLKKVQVAAEASYGQDNDKIAQELRRAFVAFDKGFGQRNIPPFNGGLFRGDALLDSLKIRDFRLADLIDFLNSYNFQSELNVNVLGHIFEQSISDIEAIKARLQQEDPLSVGKLEAVALSETAKRKRDGVFYTPDYITRYMVEQAVGGWLNDREADILRDINHDHLPELTIEDYESISLSDKGIYERNEAIALHVRFWELYQQQLEIIRVLDPACGSGAFLTQVLDFLWEKWRVMREECYKLTTPYATQLTNLATRSSMGNPQMPYREWEIKKNIVSRNLYGVDLNPESVEITKLALWLKTANKTETLANLDDHIRQGNSLVSDPAVNEYAFDWATEFEGVGFDVVVGNPPYVRQELIGREQKAYLMNNYPVGNGTADLYVYFYDRAIRLIRNKGYIGYITPNKFIKAGYGKPLRQYLSNLDIKQLVDFGELPVFADAATFPIIVLARKQPSSDTPTLFAKIQSLGFASLDAAIQERPIWIDQSRFKAENWQLTGEEQKMLFEKLRQNSISLTEYVAGKLFRGIVTGFNEAFVINRPTRDRLIAEDPASAEVIKPFVVGDNVRHYQIDFEEKYLIKAEIGFDVNRYKAVFNHLKSYQSQLEKRSDQGKFWWELRACAYYDDFEKPKIIYPDIAKEARMTFDKSGLYMGNSAYFISTDDTGLLAVLNSKLIFFYFRQNATVLGDVDKGGRLRWFRQDVERIPIVRPNPEQHTQFSALANQMLVLTEQRQTLVNQIVDLFKTDLGATKLTDKIQNWPALDWPALLDELKKQKVGVSLTKQMDWKLFYADQRAKALDLQTQRAATDRQIDELVYVLYGLTETEIALVEGS